MSDQRTPAACLEVSRNGRLCAGAKHLYDEIERLTSQVESLQNKCANRGLSPEDSDALQARVETLEGMLVRTYELVMLGRYQMADNELRQALAVTEHGENSD